MGYDGIFVTDHFTGYCPVPDPSLPWHAWVDAYCLGYEHAAEEGYKRGLQVFFGWEQTCQTDEYLIIGLDKAWLYAHPECRMWTRKQMFATVTAAGGCVIHAHPFRERSYIDMVRLYPDACHAIEVANCGNQPYMDVLARRYAEALHLPMTAGSDIHSTSQLPHAYGVVLQERLTSAADFARIVRSGEGLLLHMEAGRTIAPRDASPTLCVQCFDNEGQPRPLPPGVLP